MGLRLEPCPERQSPRSTPTDDQGRVEAQDTRFGDPSDEVRVEGSDPPKMSDWSGLPTAPLIPAMRLVSKPPIFRFATISSLRRAKELTPAR